MCVEEVRWGEGRWQAEWDQHPPLAPSQARPPVTGGPAGSRIWEIPMTGLLSKGLPAWAEALGSLESPAQLYHRGTWDSAGVCLPLPGGVDTLSYPAPPCTGRTGAPCLAFAGKSCGEAVGVLSTEKIPGKGAPRALIYLHFQRSPATQVTMGWKKQP